MSEKVFEDLYLNTTGGGSATGVFRATSRAISIGSHNGAMFEVTLKSANNLQSNGVALQVEGSNDGQNWSPNVFGGTSTTIATNTGTSAPRYQAVIPTTSAVIPFSMLRITAALVTPTASAQAAILDASLRTFQKA